MWRIQYRQYEILLPFFTGNTDRNGSAVCILELSVTFHYKLFLNIICFQSSSDFPLVYWVSSLVFRRLLLIPFTLWTDKYQTHFMICLLVAMRFNFAQRIWLAQRTVTWKMLFVGDTPLCNIGTYISCSFGTYLTYLLQLLSNNSIKIREPILHSK